MKKLYELTAEQDKPFLYFMQRTTDLTAACEKVLDKIRQAEFLLNDWLADTEHQSVSITDARAHLQEAIELLEGPNGHSSGLQAGNADAQHHV
jgi:hypothetical protein